MAEAAQLSAYQRFSEVKRKEFAEKYPGISFIDLPDRINRMWAELTAQDRAAYEQPVAVDPLGLTSGFTFPSVTPFSAVSPPTPNVWSFSASSSPITFGSPSAVSSTVTKPMLASSLTPFIESPDEVKRLADEVQSYTAAHGITMRTNQKTLVHAPCTLLPSPFHRSSFMTVVSAGKTFNTLYEKISRDTAFLLRALAPVIKLDTFTARLAAIQQTLHEEGGPVQPFQLCINRSDYMMHFTEETSSYTPLQVEFNTIAASFASLSNKVGDMHRFLCKRYYIVPTADIPVNRALDGIISALHVAHCHYKNAPYSASLPPSLLPVIVMIVQPNETNTTDQKLIEYGLYSGVYTAPMIRLTLNDIHNRGRLHNQHLIIDMNYVCTVAYYRAGYSPRDYPSEDEWSALLLIERSLAIKCPTVAYHLSGAKKIQQVLAEKGQVEQFVGMDDAKQLRSVFAGLYALDSDNDETLKLIEYVITHPNEYVLKPCREGGGNNIWGEDIVKTIQTNTRESLAQYILMEKIKAPTCVAAFLRQTQYSIGESISELGIYGTMFTDGKQHIINDCVGHLLRTKQSNVNEGGVAAGYSHIDSPILID